MHGRAARQLTARIRAGLVAFAAGDALGAPWEGAEPDEVGPLVPLRRREDWPLGATSDDTAQLLLCARALLEPDPPRAFLVALAEAAPAIRGMGPSSLAAVERFRRDGSLAAEAGATNGAAMRAPAVGWAVGGAAERDGLAAAIARTTHGATEAIAAAREVAELADALLRGEGPPEAPAVHGPIGLGAAETVAAVRAVLAGATSVADAAQRAVRLGGDTDTVAALAAGLLAAHPDHAGDAIPWLDEVALPDGLDEVAAALARRRQR